MKKINEIAASCDSLKVGAVAQRLVAQLRQMQRSLKPVALSTLETEPALSLGVQHNQGRAQNQGRTLAQQPHQALKDQQDKHLAFSSMGLISLHQAYKNNRLKNRIRKVLLLLVLAYSLMFLKIDIRATYVLQGLYQGIVYGWSSECVKWTCSDSGDVTRWGVVK